MIKNLKIYCDEGIEKGNKSNYCTAIFSIILNKALG